MKTRRAKRLLRRTRGKIQTALQSYSSFSVKGTQEQMGRFMNYVPVPWKEFDRENWKMLFSGVVS